MKVYKLVFLFFLVNFGIQAQELVTGKASLIKVDSGIYDIKLEDGTRKQINIRPNVEEHLQGTLSVLFKECEELRQSVFEIEKITEDDLINLVNKYNSCSYSPFTPTEKEVRQSANFQGDKFKLFASAGASLNRISFFNFDDYENLTQGQFSFGIAATPGFIGSLQGSLYFTMELSAAFSGDKDFENSPFETNFKKSGQRAQVGLEYHFNKNGAIRPLIGVSAGLARDHYDGTYNGNNINQGEGSGFVMPKVGFLYSLDSKKSLGLIISYIPEYENDLTFLKDGNLIPLIIDTNYINAGLYLYF